MKTATTKRAQVNFVFSLHYHSFIATHSFITIQSIDIKTMHAFLIEFRYFFFFFLLQFVCSPARPSNINYVFSLACNNRCSLLGMKMHLTGEARLSLVLQLHFGIRADRFESETSALSKRNS